MKEAGNDILTFSAGEERKGGYIFQAYELVYVECYRATLSDGNKATTESFIQFYPKYKCGKIFEGLQKCCEDILPQNFNRSITIMTSLIHTGMLKIRC